MRRTLKWNNQGHRKDEEKGQTHSRGHNYLRRELKLERQISMTGSGQDHLRGQNPQADQGQRDMKEKQKQNENTVVHLQGERAESMTVIDVDNKMLFDYLL